MDSPTPETLEQLRMENQRLRAHIAALEAHGEPAPLIAGFAPYGQPIWFDAVSDAIFVADAAWHIRHWNQAAELIYGWPRAEAVGRPISELIAVMRYADGESDESSSHALAATGIWRGTFVQRTRDGRELVIEGATRALFDAQGAITGYIAINRDITERARSEETLRRAAERLQVLANASHAFAEAGADAQAVLDHVAHITADALGARCIIRLRADDSPWLDTVTIYDRDPAVQAVLDAAFADSRIHIDDPNPAAVVARNGQPLLIPVIDPERIRATVAPELWSAFVRVRPHSTIVTPLRAHGQILGVLSFSRHARELPALTPDDLTLAQDLADRAALAITNAQLYQQAQAAQQAAAEALARLDTLIASVPTGIAYLDTELRYQLVNPALAALNGRTPTEHLGRTLAEVIPGAAAQIAPLMREVLATGTVAHDLELHGLPHPLDDVAHNVLISLFPVPGPAGEVAGVGVTITDITQHTRAEAALRTSEARFRQLAEHAHDVIYRYRLAPTLTLEYISPAIERMTGYPSEAFYRDPGFELTLVYPDDLPLIQQVFADFTALAQSVVLRWWHRDGSTRWAELHSWLIADEAGQPLAIEGIARDITARRQADEALRASQQNLMTLIENTDGLIWSVDRQYRLLVGNGLFQRYVRTVLGRDPVPGDEMVALPMPQVLLDEWRIYYDRALAGEAFSVEVPSRLSAEPRTGEYRLSPIRTATGVITGVTVFGRDITARQRADRALQETERKLGTLFALLPVGIAIFDGAGDLVYVNPALEQIMRMDRANLFNGEHLARHYLRADGTPMPPEEYAHVRASYAHEAVTNLEIGYSTETDATIWTSISAVPVDFPDWRVVMVTIDITARKQAEAAAQAHAEALSRTNAELTHALRLKDEFLAMMSHELRTPLSVVLGVSEAMEEEIYGPISAEQRQALGTVMLSGRHLLTILSDILDLARMEAGQERIDRQPIDVDTLCQSALQLVQAAAQQKGIRLRRSVEQGVDGLRADERRLTQILVNLLDNAIKFTPAGGSAGLDVVADTEREQIQFVVWDTGIGIAEADYARLFQPFSQVDGTLSRSYGGVGLGLSLVHRLVDLHGGSIQLESTLGQGSRFTISLPWAEGDNVVPLVARMSAAQLQPWIHPLRVVLADDHEPTLAFYRDMLTKQGGQVAVARTGEEALAQVRATHPDVVALDIQMPGMDGLEAIRHIRADPTVAAVPIIALTALAMPGDRERCLAAGASAYLAKPVGLRILIATITEVLTGAGESPT